jgi:hypothetical protein
MQAFLGLIGDGGSSGIIALAAMIAAGVRTALTP